jgi:hypothetical protein
MTFREVVTGEVLDGLVVPCTLSDPPADGTSCDSLTLPANVTLPKALDPRASSCDSSFFCVGFGFM